MDDQITHPDIYEDDPLAILSVADLKQELRLIGDNNEHDAMLTRQIKAAVGFVQEVVGRPILDRWEQVPVDFLPSGQEPLLVYKQPFARNVHRLTYTGYNQSAGDDPTVVDLLGESPKVRVQWIKHCPLVVYPRGSYKWPRVKADTPILLEVGSGTPVKDDLKLAIVTVACAFYNQNFDEAGPAIEGILGPLGYWGE